MKPGPMKPNPVPISMNATQAEADAYFSALTRNLAQQATTATETPDSCSRAVVLVSKTRGLLATSSYDASNVLGPTHALQGCLYKLGALETARGGTVYTVGQLCLARGDGTSCVEMVKTMGIERVVDCG